MKSLRPSRLSNLRISLQVLGKFMVPTSIRLFGLVLITGSNLTYSCRSFSCGLSNGLDQIATNLFLKINCDPVVCS
jgi:hypothetical protein